MAARFWVSGGNGLWSSTTNWSATSGGASGASVPGSADTATFNASSGAGTATVDSNVTIQTLTLTGFTGTLAFGTNTISLNSTGTVFTGDSTYTITGTPVINVTSSGSTAISCTNSTSVTEANTISFNFTGGTYGLTLTGFFRNVNFTGYSGLLSIVNFQVYGSFTASSTMTTQNTSLQTMTMQGTLTSNTIASNGVLFNFGIAVGNSSGGSSYSLVDNLTILNLRTFRFNAGTLDLNGKSLTTGIFTDVASTNARTLAFNSGSITCNGTGTIWNTNATGFTVTGTSVVNISNNSATAATVIPGALSEANSISFNFTTGTYALTFLGSASNSAKNIDFTGFAGTWNATSSGQIYGNLTLSTGMTLTASATAMTFAGTSGTKTITSNGKTMDFPITFNGIGGTFQLADAMTVGSTRTTTFTNGTLDLNGKTYTTGLFLTNNSNTRTLAFGTGNITCVSTAGGTIWQVLSTGLTVTGTPVVNISANTATATTVNVGGLNEANSISFNFTTGTYSLTFLNSASQTARSVNFTGFSGTLGNANNTRFVYGDWTFSSTMTVTAGTGGPTFASTSATQRIITCNGITWNCPVQFNGVGGYWKLADALTLGTSGQLTQTNGTLDLNGKTATVIDYVTGAGTKNLTFNGGTLVVGGAFNNAAPTNYSTTAGTGTGKISLTASTATNFNGGGIVYNCTFSNDGTGGITISGANTFTTIANGVQPTSFSFPASTTTTVTNWNVSGTAGNLVTITSSTAANHTLSKSSGTVSADYLSISRSTATGGATWYAGANSTNGGSNSGWIFTAPPPSTATGSFFFLF